MSLLASVVIHVAEVMHEKAYRMWKQAHCARLLLMCSGNDGDSIEAGVQTTSSPCETYLNAQRKDFGGRYGFPVFFRVFVSTTVLESFSLRPEMFSKRFAFGGGRVLLFFSALDV